MHLYGGTAAMSEGVMPLQWEGCESYLWPFPFPLPLPLPLPAPFPKPLTDPFSEPWSEPFSDPFSEPLGVNFPLPLLFPWMCSGGRLEVPGLVLKGSSNKRRFIHAQHRRFICQGGHHTCRISHGSCSVTKVVIKVFFQE